MPSNLKVFEKYFDNNYLLFSFPLSYKISELVSEEVENVASEEIEADVDSTVDDAISDEVDAETSGGSSSITGSAKVKELRFSYYDQNSLIKSRFTIY